MKLLIDMNLSPAWVAALAAQRIAAVHWSEVGKADAPDAELFAWARDNDCIIFTHDLDFGKILAFTHAARPSVVQLRYPNIAPDSSAGLAATILLRFQSELAQGALLAIEPETQKIRLLPLRQ